MVRERHKKDKINEYLDKRVDLERKGLSYLETEMERHIEECPDCRLELCEQQELFEILSGLEAIEPPPDFTEQVLARIPEQARQPLPNWSLLAGTVILAAFGTALFALMYWALGLTQLDFIKTIFNSALASLWDSLDSFLGEAANVAGIAWGWIKAFVSLVQAYPASFITAIAIGTLMFLVMVRLISSFQRENYA